MGDDQSQTYEVEFNGQRTGPFSRRTIVGMRIKHALSNDDVLLASDGSRQTVGDLIASGAPKGQFNASRSGAYSLVQATYPGVLLGVRGKTFDVPAFSGETEIRVQTAFLRIAGRYRQRGAWKEGRIKLPLDACVHARAVGSHVEVWLGARDLADGPMQSIRLDLFSPEAANELVRHLPGATLPPASLTVDVQDGAHRSYLAWVAVSGVLVVLTLIGVLLVRHRAF